MVAYGFLQIRAYSRRHPNPEIREMFQTYVVAGLIAFFLCWIPDQVCSFILDAYTYSVLVG